MGGKCRVARTIAEFLRRLRKPGQIYIEPFVGAGSVICKMEEPRLAYDAHPDLILMWRALQRGWKPPLFVSEELHRKLRHARSSALRAFVGFGCSFGGKFFSGYARAKKCKRGFAAECASSLSKKLLLLKGVEFNRADYRELKPAGALVYCDPPYAGTTGFRGVAPFDHAAFWQTMRMWSQHNTVIISEGLAPEDFVPVMEVRAPRGLKLAGQEKAGYRREYVFQHVSQASARL